ncbi:MAG: glutamine synthetase type III [bacterium]|nr:glutamine synthetase type III [bacterium]
MSEMQNVYGELVFNKQIMNQKLSKDVYKKLLATIDKGEALDQSIAGEVAHAMKEWAIENGATHFTHWFQPQRGGTAQKHDAFLTYGEGEEIVERFSEGQLIQSEPDASSFPSGGIRSTFEARGYTAWDPTSPVFLLEARGTKTLVIPSVFLSWTGEVLDLKTPLLRSEHALNSAAIKLQKLLGNRTSKRIVVHAGPEQEYFLFAKELVETRPDLKICGRTLFGAEPAKGQQMDDHYFGSIKGKILNFMEDLDRELYRRGIPSKTRHNEVAPNQFEVAPIFQIANLAVDNNLQMMELIKNVADKYGLVAILHEKPMAGVNGSGKHYNWSLGDNSGVQYLRPSKSPLKNISFLMTIGAVLLGVKKFGGVLRASIADAGNDHRLGANEAPPAIMSIYLGEYLDELFNSIEGIGKITDKKVNEISLGVQNLPKIAKDYSDRNRTSPIAFTGNKFELRAVGSTHNCAEPGAVMNLLCAYGYDEIRTRIEVKQGEDVKNKALEVLKEVLKETKGVRFEGNGYAEEWHQEAEKRGLPNAKNTPQALELMFDKEVMKAFVDYNILSEREIKSKVEIKLEAYNNVKDIEYKMAIKIANTLIIPAILNQISETGGAATIVEGLGIADSAIKADVAELSKLYAGIKNGVKALEEFIVKAESEGDLHKQAHLYAEEGADTLAELRANVDAAEEIVADYFWPLASYQELLTEL